jgi:hypothetical protein
MIRYPIGLSASVRVPVEVFVPQGVPMPLGPNPPIANSSWPLCSNWPSVAFKLTKGDVDKAVKPDVPI